MRRPLVVLGVVSALVFGVGSGFGQGLGDSAKREREKRARKGEASAPTPFTDDDLSQRKPAPGDRDAATSPAADAADESTARVDPARKAPAGTDPLEQERQERVLLEYEWRARFAHARERLAVAEAGAWRNAYKVELVAGVPVQVRYREQVETEELLQARQVLVDLQEEFRRTGLPPGWARQE